MRGGVALRRHRPHARHRTCPVTSAARAQAALQSASSGCCAQKASDAEPSLGCRRRRTKAHVRDDDDQRGGGRRASNDPGAPRRGAGRGSLRGGRRREGVCVEAAPAPRTGLEASEAERKSRTARCPSRLHPQPRLQPAPPGYLPRRLTNDNDSRPARSASRLFTVVFISSPLDVGAAVPAALTPSSTVGQYASSVSQGVHDKHVRRRVNRPSAAGEPGQASGDWTPQRGRR